MTDKIYQVVLSGKIADGRDKDVVQEKLAIVFDIDLKKIPKLLKKPTIIRKQLSREVALRYQQGLTRIGVPCEIYPPLAPAPIINTEAPPLPNELPVSKKQTLVIDGKRLRVRNIKMPFWSMVIFFIKWALASIPALIVLTAIGYAVKMGIPMLLEVLK